MAGSRMDAIVDHLRRAVQCGDLASLTDGQLLQRFIDGRDAVAFECLVRRHSAMVMGVARRLVGNPHDAEDVFQATFLVLARKAASVSSPDAVGSWLYGVARTTALRVRVANAKRRSREKLVADVPEPQAGEHALWSELVPLLDQELSRLSEKHRAAVILCELEGRTRKEAARHLKIPEGTVASRLAKARKLLAQRLCRRGLDLSAGALACLLSDHGASAAVPAALVHSTAKTAGQLATGQAVATAIVSASVAALMEGVLKAMLVTKLKTATAALMVAIVASAGIALATREAVGQPESKGRAGASTATPSLAITSKKDIDLLQGVWRVTSINGKAPKTKGPAAVFQANGNRPEAGLAEITELLPDEAVFMVNGNRACWQISVDGEYDEMQGGLYLDPASSPKAYDFATSRRTFEGIYALKGNTLRLCYDPAYEGKRPGAFSRTVKSRVVMVLKRDPKLDIRGFRLADGTLGTFPQLIERRGPTPPPPAVATTPTSAPATYGTYGTTVPLPPPRAENKLAPGEMEAWWAELEKSDAEASRALLRFAARPHDAVAFFKTKVKPLKIDVARVRALVGRLADDRAEVWKPAFEELEYFDPRLAIDLEPLLKEVTKSPARQRLVALLCDKPADTFAGWQIDLAPVGGTGEFNFMVRIGGGSWWAEHRVARLAAAQDSPRRKWTRCIRALMLLENIGTPDAIELLRDMARGHPDVQPTRVAREVLDRIGR